MKKVCINDRIQVADITKEKAKELNLHVLRMPVIVDGKEYMEAETITDEEVLEHWKHKKV